MKHAKTGKPDNQPPYETDALESIRKRKFRHTLFFYMSLDERRRWIKMPLLTDFRVFSCGLFEKAQGHCRERTDHGEGVLVYCVAGKGTFRQDGKEWAIQPGDIFYASPMSHHRYTAAAADPWTIHWMHVSGKMTRHYERLLGLSPSQPTLRLGIQPEIIYQFNVLYNLFRSVYDDRHMRAISSCAQLILAQIAILAATRQAPSPSSLKVDEILRAMEATVDEDLDLAHFAALAGMTPTYFSRLFKKATGSSPIDTFLRLKIRKACLLLATTDMLVKQIAYQLSFHNAIHFTCLFKKTIGLTPIAYRRGRMSLDVIEGD